MRSENLPKVLVVDDDKAALLLFDSILKGMPAEIVKCSNAAQAMNMLARHEFALLILDVYLPDFSGFDLAQAARDEGMNTKTPIVFVSGIRKQERYIFKGYEQGAVDYMLKPVQRVVMRKKVMAYIRIFEQKQALEQQLRLLRSHHENLTRDNSEMKHFAYVAAHDLRSPLITIHSLTNLLREEYGQLLEGNGVDYVDHISSSIHRMLNLLENLVGFVSTSDKTLNFVPVDLSATVANVLDDLAAEIEISGAKVTTQGLPTINADESLMHQLFQNLVSNAVKYRDPERTLRLEIIATSHPDADHVQIEVTDNGLGFDQKRSDFIFQPFNRIIQGSMEQGAGLGLSIVRNIVMRHLGDIQVQSTPNFGSTFSLNLPKKQPVDAATAQLRQGVNSILREMDDKTSFN